MLSRDAILEAARHCFFSYGYQRTRIGDIADRAGVSRAHVYNHFENKQDVFCALAGELLEASFTEIEAVLGDAAAEIWSRVEAAFKRWSGLYFELMKTPHGGEVLEQANQFVGLLADAHARFEKRLTAELERARVDGAISFDAAGLSAAGCADTLVAAADGFKSLEADQATYDKRLRSMLAALRIATQPA